MGNVCGTSGSHHVYSPPVSPRHVSGSSTPVHNVAGQALTSVYQLSDEAREDFLSRHDPMQKLGLHSETALYRTTDKTYLRGGKLAGNPESCARIGLHEELAPNPYAQHYGIPEGDSRAYRPREMRASDLRDPSLNVMVGSEARDAVRGYASGNHVAVKMRLGDFLEKGGKVYSDVSAVASNGDTASALIVTLPKGRKVPAQVVDD
ncbi:AvrPphF family type III effector [Pseudomonas syringae pv. actinidiae]|uniref:HopF n=2 Tax=Pseudomonas syringae TaxID=317 RepID=A0A3M5MWS9_PSESX|nr:AvrPphF family type III effector [Pseudomonas syringae]EPN07199.1 type III effector HopF2 [Pseudomonas syringae pv. actinidiae ICMP 19070]EPN54895.1 type III effector HopF2 [Pseudomonas syringae pv. actinidiae ICMP 19079]EPN64919.1 type III effector HopF2 [Pseudomonas syringae pv. actinidiae ICMP 19101]AKT32571.1 type III effector HopF2 [Pseudomonas syringae pv. actinidiae ICMP 18884]AQL35877.1 type III effector [Pseudomonas syringae pv. actinidiae ICMP 9853]